MLGILHNLELTFSFRDLHDSTTRLPRCPFRKCHVDDRNFTLTTRAHKLYLNAVQLAVSQYVYRSLHDYPPTLRSSKTPNTEWYRTASAAVQAHRDKAEAEDAAKWENARRPILEQIKDKLVLIDSHSDDSTVEFVKVRTRPSRCS